MPAVIVAWAVTAGATAAGIGTAAVIGSITAAQIAGAVAGLAVSSVMASNERQKANDAARAAQLASLRDISMILDNPIVPRAIVLGRDRISGPVWPWFTSTGLGIYHVFGILLAGHECDAIEQIYFNEDLVTLDGGGNVIAPAKFCNADGQPLFTITKYLGGPGQTVSPELLNAAAGSGNPGAWDVNRRATGICYITVQMYADPRALGDIGVPKVSAVVRGAKCYDPRTGLRVWTQNPALQAAWFLVDCPYSPKTLYSEIDEPVLIASANVCDEMVAFSATRTEKRYTGNGKLSCEEIPMGNLRHILDCMDGDALPIGGKWQIDAGYYKTPSLALDEFKLSDSPVTILPYAGKSDLFNLVNGQYADPAFGYQVVSYTPVTSDVYVAEDNGETLPQPMNFALVNDSVRCQMIAWQRLSRARNGMTVQLGTSLRGYDTAPMQNVTLQMLELIGPAPKIFNVRRREMSLPRLTYTLQETGPEVWAWDYTKAAQPVNLPNASFPSVSVVDAPGAPVVTEEKYQTTGSTGVRARALLSCSESVNVLVVRYLFEYKRADATVWTQLSSSNIPSTSIDDIAPGTYNFRVRAENGIQIRSPYSTVTTREVLGLTDDPANMTGLSVIAIAGRAHWSADLSPDLDVRIGGRVVARHTPLTSGALWENGIVLDEFNGDAVNGSLPLLTGTYMFKFKDSQDNFSRACASFVCTESQVTGFTTVATSTQAPGFAGTKTGTYVDSGTLRLAGATLIDSMATLIDSWGYIDTLGGVSPAGSYDFDAFMDLATVKSVRLAATIQALAIDSGDLIDDRGDVDSWGTVDGGVINDVDATLYYATTQTNPAASPVWGPWTPFMTADVTARGVKYRLDVVSGSPTHNEIISTLTVTARTSP